MGGKKALFLFLGLLLPILVFVFLKLFGRNEFEVPLLYEQGVEVKPAGCTLNYGAPYIVSDTIIHELTYSLKPLIVVNFASASVKLNNLMEAFNKDVALIEGDKMNWSAERYNFIKSCALLTQSPSNIVLIDSRHRIRGHYDGTDRDELDRLEAEMKIILKKY
jgi:hypothetical protein